MQHRELWDKKFRRLIGEQNWLDTIREYCFQGMRLKKRAASDHIRAYEAFNSPDFDVELARVFDPLA